MIQKLLAIIFLISLEIPAWAQCSMCRTALESSPEGKVLASSFAHGILMMLVLPYAVIGTFGFIIYRAYRKRQS